MELLCCPWFSGLCACFLCSLSLSLSLSLSGALSCPLCALCLPILCLQNLRKACRNLIATVLVEGLLHPGLIRFRILNPWKSVKRFLQNQLDFNEFGGAGLTWVGLGWAGLGLGQGAVVLASLNSCPNLTFLWQRVLLPMACPCVCVALGTVSTDFLLQHFWGKKFPKLRCGAHQHSQNIFLEEGGLHFARFKSYFKKKPLA